MMTRQGIGARARHRAHVAAERRSVRVSRYSAEQVAKMARLHDEEGLPWTVIGIRFGTGGTEVARLVRKGK